MSHSPSALSRVLRVLAALPLLLCAAVCVFGFLATWELPAWPQRLPLQLGYALFGMVNLLAALTLLRPRRRADLSHLH